MSLAIIESGAVLGAEISGVDLTQPIDDATFEQIRQALYRHEVIFFRGRELSDADHLRFGERFGVQRRHEPPVQYVNRTADPERFWVVSNILEDGKPIGSNDAGEVWHTDGAYLQNPDAATLLRAIEVPERNGRTFGNTVYASVSAAYDALPGAMKKRLDGLEAVHSRTKRFEKTVAQDKNIHALRLGAAKGLDAVHPVVRLHPVTRRKCLYVTQGYTVQILGLPEDESSELISELSAHCVKPEFLYSHNWRVHDLIMWDDCSTQHLATFDYALPLRRRMHRTVLEKFAN